MSNWKNFERRVAKHFGVERQGRTGRLCADILVDVDAVAKHLLLPYWNGNSLVIECKYSIDQSWHRMLVEHLDPDKSKVSLVCADDLIFWELKYTDCVLFDLHAGTSFQHMLDNYRVRTINRKPSKFLTDSLEQAKKYALKKNTALVALGQKGSPRVFVYTTLEQLV